MKKLAEGYSVEFDDFDKDSWHGIIKKFADGNIYQTWSYDAIRYGRENISHMVLKKKGAVVAAAQARMVKIPLINAGIAYIRWGPLWHLQGKPVDKDVFCQAIRALRNEYVCKRGLVLRIMPLLFSDDSATYCSLLRQEKFSGPSKKRRDKTILMDLRPPLEDLRKGLKQSWRRQLMRAEKNALQVIEGEGDELFEMFLSIYREMVDRKKYVETSNIKEFRLIQKDLPDNFKMKILLCRSNGKIYSGLICSAIGDTGIYLFGATSNDGLESRGSYLLHWKLIELLKKYQITWYNLHGINPEKNPGTYRFKAGLSGKNGKEALFLGQFDAYKSPSSVAFVKCGDFFLSNYRKTKELVHDLRYAKN